MLPLPLRSVPPEVLLPVQYSHPFHPEAQAACRNSDGLIPEIFSCVYEIGCSQKNSERGATMLSKSSEADLIFPALDYRN